METKRQLRCAIYTRKSSEEGLEQDFNSLHAQREACEAYITSQVGEGWRLVKTHYDDGGFSGGSMDRPAHQQLLADLSAGRVDVVVVYKVDRLTRSLSDFAKIVDVFDKQGASFVSVTQSFNTTTSMGRLTLNVLLSFAQFEREVTGERIRDKIAASCKKGMWMGGNPPLGYNPKERTLAINPVEAETVRMIFVRYLELRSVKTLTEELAARGIGTKRWIAQSGRTMGGGRFARGGLYHLLKNPVYIGQILHRGNTYPGQHEAILDQALWRNVQDLLKQNTAHHSDKIQRSDEESFLKGLLIDDRGNPMSPHYTSKGRGRLRYYVSQALLQARKADAGSLPRVSATQIEGLVLDILARVCRKSLASRLTQSAPARRTLLVESISEITLGRRQITLSLKPDADVLDASASDQPGVKVSSTRDRTTLIIDLKGLDRSAGALVIAPEYRTKTETTLKTALARAWRWRSLLESGPSDSILAIAKKEGANESYIKKVLPLAFLPPARIEHILSGGQLTKVGKYRSWDEREISWTCT